MPDAIRLVLDGREIPARPGQTLLEAAEAAGAWIPRLCHWPGVEAYGGCRICTVKVNGRPVAACTHPAEAGQVVESESAELSELRRVLLELLLVEGNHFCMSCEKSGSCELQALAYRLGIAAPRFEARFPERALDASHPDLLIDRNRCILCARCVRVSRDLDGKNVFGLVGRGAHRAIAVNSPGSLADTEAAASDRAMQACPVGALLRKRVGFAVPLGRRPYDSRPIGSAIGPDRERPR